MDTVGRNKAVIQKVYPGAVARRPNSGANDAKGTCRPIHRRIVQIRKSPSIEGLHVNVVRLVNFQGAYSPRQVKRLLAVDQTTRYTGSFDCFVTVWQDSLAFSITFNPIHWRYQAGSPRQLCYRPVEELLVPVLLIH